MSIQLTKPFNPGDLNPGVTYPTVLIVGFIYNELSQAAIIQYEYGTYDSNNNWQRGPGTSTMTCNIAGADFNALVRQPVSTPPPATTFLGVKNLLDSYLVNKGIVVGTPV